MATIHILRHGQSLHNVQRGYPHRDPPLTELGHHQASTVQTPAKPDLILISPMTRTIQTALLAFSATLPTAEVQIWPELREAHDAICNKGVGRAELAAKFPELDFSACRDAWDYEPHSSESAALRAERVRRRLKDLSGSYANIFVVSHRGFIAFLVQGERFRFCDCRSFRFATHEEVDGSRYGVNIDTDAQQDFGPTLLLPATGTTST